MTTMTCRWLSILMMGCSLCVAGLGCSESSGTGETDRTDAAPSLDVSSTDRGMSVDAGPEIDAGSPIPDGATDAADFGPVHDATLVLDIDIDFREASRGF